MLISLAEYAQKHSLNHSVIRKRAASGGFATAQKICGGRLGFAVHLEIDEGVVWQAEVDLLLAVVEIDDHKECLPLDMPDEREVLAFIETVPLRIGDVVHAAFLDRFVITREG